MTELQRGGSAPKTEQNQGSAPANSKDTESLAHRVMGHGDAQDHPGEITVHDAAVGLASSLG